MGKTLLNEPQIHAGCHDESEYIFLQPTKQTKAVFPRPDSHVNAMSYSGCVPLMSNFFFFFFGGGGGGGVVKYEHLHTMLTRKLLRGSLHYPSLPKRKMNGLFIYGSFNFVLCTF